MQIPVCVLIGSRNIDTLAVVHIYYVLLVLQYHPPGLVGHLDVVRVHLLLGFRVQVPLYLFKPRHQARLLLLCIYAVRRFLSLCHDVQRA